MRNRRVLISGAGIAGPAAAWWLDRYGFDVTVVERAPAPRRGGFAVDFRGAAHLSVLRRMGLLDAVRQQQTAMGAFSFIDASGAVTARLPASFLSGDVEIRRGDLSQLLYERTRDRVTYRFGDSIRSIVQTDDGVDVTFDVADRQQVDLVIGADGMHSNVRRLVFGEESRFPRFGGYYIAGFAAPNWLGLDHTTVNYGTPGKSVSVGSGRDPAVCDVSFVFASEAIPNDRDDVAAQKRIVASVFADIDWEASHLHDLIDGTPDWYFDSISQVHLEALADRRVVLLGDAGYGATVGGLGTGLAVVAASILAGELAAVDGDYERAFASYSHQIVPYARGCQKLANGAGPFLAPRTAWERRQRTLMYRLLGSPLLSGLLNRLTTRAANAIALQEYPAPAWT